MRRVVFFLVAIAALGQGGASLAQNLDGPFTTGPLVCESPDDLMQPLVGFDCGIEIVPENVDNIYAARIVDEAHEGQYAIVEATCYVYPEGVDWVAGNAPVLFCPEVGRNTFEGGERTIRLFVNDSEVEGAELTIRTAFSSTNWTVLEEDQVVFAGRPLRLRMWDGADSTVRSLVVRRRGTGEQVAVFDAAAPDPATLDSDTEVDLPPGSYRVWACSGASSDECEVDPGGFAFQAIDPSYTELIPGHNRLGADRINILFAGADIGAPEWTHEINSLPEVARVMLGFDGPTISSSDEWAPPEERDPRFANRALWGPMAIEPLRSNRHKFNFWTLDTQLTHEGGFVLEDDPLRTDDDPGRPTAGFDLPNLSITTLYTRAETGLSFAASTTDARFPTPNPQPIESESVEGIQVDAFDPRLVVDAESVNWGTARVLIAANDPYSQSQVMAHEWGHALFGLRDEYTSNDREVGYGWPNCARDEAQAQEWWGDRVGQVDPFVTEVQDFLKEIDAVDTFRPDWPDLIETKTAAGGCYGDLEAAVLRPSEQSIMNLEANPVFGTVNRDWMSVVLNRFTGRGPMSSFADVDLTCDYVDEFVRCAGLLAEFVDPPDVSLVVGGMPCDFQSGEPVTVSCPDVEAGATVEATFGDERTQLDVRGYVPPAADPIADDDEVPAEDATRATGDADSDGGIGSIVFVVLLLVCIAAVAPIRIWFVRRSIRRESRQV